MKISAHRTWFEWFSVAFTSAVLILCVFEICARIFIPGEKYHGIRDVIFNKGKQFLNVDGVPAGKTTSIAKEIVPARTLRDYEDNTGLGMDLFPYTWLQSPGGLKLQSLSTNRQGFRAGELEDIAADPRKKVILLGGSAMWGMYSESDAATIAGNLQKLLDAHGLGLQVVNLAQPAFQSISELITLERVGLRFDVRYVVVMDGANDASTTIWQPAAGAPCGWVQIHNLMRREVEVINSLRSPPAALAKSLRIVQLIRGNGGSIASSLTDAPSPDRAVLFDVKSQDGIKQEMREQYYLNMRSLLQLCRANGIRVILLTQPSVGRARPANGLEGRLSSFPFFDDSMVSISDAQKKLAREYGIVQYDASEILNADHSGNPHMLDIVHLSAAGNRLIADWLSGKIFAMESHRQGYAGLPLKSRPAIIEATVK